MLFRIHTHLSYGAALHIVGSTPALGLWDPDRAPACQWTSGDVWQLSINPVSSPVPTRFEFKCLIRHPNQPDAWENSLNHAVVVPQGADPSSANVSVNVPWEGSHEIVLPPAPTPGTSPPPTPSRPHNDPLLHAPSPSLPLAAAKVAAAANGTGGKPHLPNLPRVPHQLAVFRVKMSLPPGEYLYIVGSCAALGAWNKMHSPRLERTAGVDIHQVTIRLPGNDPKHTNFEYKYLIRARDGARRWEQGPNRVADASKMKSAVEGAAEDVPEGATLWDDRWERMRMEFSIYWPVKEHERMHITGDLKELGSWFKPGPVAMMLGPMQQLETDVRGRKWCLKVWVEPTVQSFSYRYIVINQVSKFELWEREPNRRAEWDAEEEVVNCVRVCKDVNFVSEMKFDAVPPDMFIGPYPQSEADVEAVVAGGGTAVLNVQTDEDFEHRGVQWDMLMRRYEELGVKVVRYPIRDFDRDSLREQLMGAVQQLDELLRQGRKVYIHCTAGMGRAPACAVGYLCWVKGMELNEAVAHVKKFRTVAVPNVPVLEQALKQPFTRVPRRV